MNANLALRSNECTLRIGSHSMFCVCCSVYRLTPTGGGSQQQITASFTLDWVAYTPCFDFDTDLHPRSLCDGMAREIWSRERFNDLKL